MLKLPKLLTVLPAAALGLTVSIATVSAYAHTDLTLVNFGGQAGYAMMQSGVRPWMSNTGKHVEMVNYGGGIAEIRSQVQQDNVTWDVVDMEYSDLIQACEAGLLEKIDHSTLSAGSDGKGVKDDFVGDSLHECGVGNIIWATVYAYNNAKYPGKKPSTIADFFDTGKFPGKRGLRRDPRGALEWALMADGVPYGDVYKILGTDAGIERAFAKLNDIKSDLVWWTGGQEPVALLKGNKVAMTAAWNGRLEKQVIQDKSVTIVWEGQLWEIEFYAIPKGTRNLENALDYLKLVTSTEGLANQAKYIAYGPVRRSSHALVSAERKPHLPTSHMDEGLRYNSRWWADNLGPIMKRFDAWAEQGSADTDRAVRF